MQICNKSASPDRATIATSAKYFIYGLIDPRNDELRYIGQSSTGVDRPCRHGHPSSYNKFSTYAARWVKSLALAGLKYEVVVLQECDSVHDVNDAEIYHIGLWKMAGCRLTNMTPGGDGNKSIPSAETRVKMSIAQKMRPPRSAEWCAAQGKARRGHVVITESCKQKLRAKMLGRKASPEARAKMSASQRLRPPPSQETCKKLSAASSRSEHIEFLREMSRRPEVREKQKTATSELWKDPEYRNSQKVKRKAVWDSDPDRKQKTAQQAAERWADPAFKEMVRKKMSEAWVRRRAAKSST